MSKDLDEIDLKILSALKKNARKSFRKIASELGVSPMTVIKRVRRMEKLGVILGYTVLLDESKLSDCNLCVLVRVKPGHDVEKVGRRITEMQECICVNYVAGKYDLALMISCKDKERAGEVLKKLKAVDGVEDVETHLLIKKLGPTFI